MTEDEAHEVVTGDDDLVCVAVGAKDGYVANDGHLLPSEETG